MQLTICCHYLPLLQIAYLHGFQVQADQQEDVKKAIEKYKTL